MIWLILYESYNMIHVIWAILYEPECGQKLSLEPPLCERDTARNDLAK